jgi:ribonucleotide monophosphatase NagD (HAD superfamily)
VLLRFVTNTVTQSERGVIAFLTTLGINIEPSEFFSAPMATRAYLKSNESRPYLIVHPNIHRFTAT